jgi:hypothetical protein
MALRFCAVLVASALVLGCGGGDGGKPAGGGSSGGAKAPGKAREALPFPEKTLKDVKGSLAAESKLTDQNVDSYIKYMKSLAELQKTAGGDPMAAATRIQNLPKESGFKDEKDMEARMKQVAGGLHLLVVMASAEGAQQAAGMVGPGSGDLKAAYDKLVGELQKDLGETQLSEADLRLIHRRMPDLQKIGESR